MKIDISIGTTLKTLWNFACGFLQFFIDHKFALTFFILFPLIVAAIFLIGYCEIEKRYFLNIIKTPAFFIPTLFLMLTALFVLLLTVKESNPPDDGKLYIAMAKLGRTDAASELLNCIDSELKKLAPFTNNLIIVKIRNM